MIATRCAVPRGEPQRPCNCAYFVLVLSVSDDAPAGVTVKSTHPRDA